MKRLSIVYGLLFALLGLVPLACSGSGGGGGGGGGGPAHCEDDTGCKDGLHCSSEGSCVQCTSDGHCGRAQVCSAASLSCMFRDGWGAECQGHDGCGLGMVCVQGLCLPDEDGYFQRCGSLGQCPEGLRCNRPLDVCEEDIGCFSNGDCVEGEVCNPGTGLCEAACTPETEQVICGIRQHCAEGRCVECSEDGDCGPGLTCNVLAGRCAGSTMCFSDRECPAGKVCNRATSTCTEPPPPCDSDDDCLDDERCDLSRGRCVMSSCRPDQYEPNGGADEATSITAGTLRDLSLCGPEDEDWFRISLRAGDRLNVNVETDVLSSGGLDVQLRDGSGRILKSNPLLVDHTVPTAGDYFVRVVTSDTQARYTLHVLVVRGVPCEDDPYEPNNEPSEAAAVRTGNHTNFQACPGDPDWFVVDVPLGKRIVATLTHDPLKGDLDLFLFDTDGRTQLASSRTIEPVEEVSSRNVTGGKAYLLVLPGDARSQNAYDLSIAVQ